MKRRKSSVSTIHRPMEYSEMNGCELRNRHKNIKPIYPHK